MGLMIVTFGKDKSLIRARPMLPGEQRFNTKDDFSFKPQWLNTTYQRASTPNRTMFYASTIREDLPQGEFDSARVIGLAESMPWIRDKSVSGLRKIAYGKWSTHEPLNLVAIVNKTGYHEVNSFSKEIYNAFISNISIYPEELKNSLLGFHDLLANEFSKDVNSHTEYQISAIFSELICNDFKIDGILYPSFRMEGKGLNVAIKPESMFKLGLYVAGEFNVYKLKENTVLGYGASIELDGKTEQFEMIDEERDVNEYLKILGVKSIEELNKMDTFK